MIKGNYSLKITYKGKSVSSSPYKVAVTSEKALKFSNSFYSRNIPS